MWMLLWTASIYFVFVMWEYGLSGNWKHQVISHAETFTFASGLYKSVKMCHKICVHDLKCFNRDLQTLVQLHLCLFCRFDHAVYLLSYQVQCMCSSGYLQVVPLQFVLFILHQFDCLCSWRSNPWFSNLVLTPLLLSRRLQLCCTSFQPLSRPHSSVPLFATCVLNLSCFLKTVILS